jgi:hypothetical protein
MDDEVNEITLGADLSPTTEKDSEEIGSKLMSSFVTLEKGINELTKNLENQFNDSKDEASPIRPLESFSDSREMDERKQIDDIIGILNDNNSESSDEDPFKNPSFDELESLSISKKTKKMEHPEDLETSDEFSSKIFELITSMKNRAESIPGDDEWDNDEDSGYIMMTLTDQEFFDYEDVGFGPFFVY